MAADLPAAVASQVKTAGLPYAGVDIISGIVGGLIGGVSYQDSRDEGVSQLTAMLSSHANGCPNQLFVLAGLSQGADVIATTLSSLDLSTSLGQHIETHIAGVALFGDPRFDPFDNADLGSFNPAHSGIFKRWPTPPDIKPEGVRPPLTAYAGRLKSYCNQGDPICNYSFTNAVSCFGQKTWDLITAAIATGVIGATLTALLDSGDYFKASCPHLHYRDGMVQAPAVNTAKAGAKLAKQVLAALYPITIEPQTLPEATAGSYYQAQLGAVGGTGQYKWSAIGLPTWLQMNNGLLSGTPPSTATDAAFSVTITDGYKSSSQTYTLHVLPSEGGNTWATFSVSGAAADICGIRADGTLWCWGDNTYGELGTGNSTPVLTPTQVGTATDWATVSIGWRPVVSGSYQDYCATRTSGTLWCWGDNRYGQLGTGNTTSEPTPTQVGAASDWAKVSVGGDDTCAIRSEGTLWCWGGGGPFGPTDSHSVPTQVGTVSNWATVSVGLNDICATRADGTLWCWGANANGELGIGNTTYELAPTRVGTASDWAMVSGGYQDFCATRTDGTLWCWGNGAYGELGTGNTTSELTPTRVGTTADWATVSASSDNGSDACATRNDGTLWCWGANEDGQLGLGTAGGNHMTPTQVGTSPGWGRVSISVDDACATRTDGTLWCWGNITGELTPTQVS
jgi:hypothetical protein